MASKRADSESAGSMAPAGWVSRRLVMIGGVTFLFGILGGLLALRDPIDRLTREGLDEARRQWSNAGIGDYTVNYSMNRDEYEVVCRGGIVRDVQVNGRQPRSSGWHMYGIEGLFDVLAMDLQNLDDPYGPFAGASQKVFLRARFHPEWGYVEKYIRSSVGAVKGASIEVSSFRRDRP